MVFCKNCIYFMAYRGSPREPECCAPQNEVAPDLLYGNKDYPFACFVRQNVSRCGPEGRWFKPHPPPPYWWRRLLGY
jgi:hypothetical protein